MLGAPSNGAVSHKTEGLRLASGAASKRAIPRVVPNKNLARYSQQV